MNKKTLLLLSLFFIVNIVSAQLGSTDIGTISSKTIDGKVWIEARATADSKQLDVETFRVLNTTFCQGACEILFEISNPTKDDIKSSITTDLAGSFKLKQYKTEIVNQPSYSETPYTCYVLDNKTQENKSSTCYERTFIGNLERVAVTTWYPVENTIAIKAGETAKLKIIYEPKEKGVIKYSIGLKDENLLSKDVIVYADPYLNSSDPSNTSQWYHEGRDIAGTGYYPGVMAHPLSLVALWTITPWSNYGPLYSLINNGVVYGCDNNVGKSMRAFDLYTGRTIWAVTSQGTTNFCGQTMAFADNMIFAGQYADSAKLYAYDAATGTRIWTAATSTAAANSGIGVYDGLVVLASQTTTNGLQVFNETTGSLICSMSTTGNLYNAPIFGNVSGTMMGFISDAGSYVYAFNPYTCSQYWKSAQYGTGNTNVVYDNQYVYYCSGGTAATSGICRKLDARDGVPVWATNIGNAGTSSRYPSIGLTEPKYLIVTNGNSVTVASSNVVAVDIYTGNVVWTSSIPNNLGNNYIPSIVGNQWVTVTCSGNNIIYFLNYTNGQQITTISGISQPRATAFADGIMVFSDYTSKEVAYTDALTASSIATSSSSSSSSSSSWLSSMGSTSSSAYSSSSLSSSVLSSSSSSSSSIVMSSSLQSSSSSSSVASSSSQSSSKASSSSSSSSIVSQGTVVSSSVSSSSRASSSQSSLDSLSTSSSSSSSSLISSSVKSSSSSSSSIESTIASSSSSSSSQPVSSSSSSSSFVSTSSAASSYGSSAASSAVTSFVSSMESSISSSSSTSSSYASSTSEPSSSSSSSSSSIVTIVTSSSSSSIIESSSSSSSSAASTTSSSSSSSSAASYESALTSIATSVISSIASSSSVESSTASSAVTSAVSSFVSSVESSSSMISSSSSVYASTTSSSSMESSSSTSSSSSSSSSIVTYATSSSQASIATSSSSSSFESSSSSSSAASTTSSSSSSSSKASHASELSSIATFIVSSLQSSIASSSSELSSSMESSSSVVYGSSLESSSSSSSTSMISYETSSSSSSSTSSSSSIISSSAESSSSSSSMLVTTTLCDIAINVSDRAYTLCMNNASTCSRYWCLNQTTDAFGYIKLGDDTGVTNYTKAGGVLSFMIYAATFFSFITLIGGGIPALMLKWKQ